MCKLLSGPGNTKMNETCILPSKSRKDRKMSNRKLPQGEVSICGKFQEETEGVVPCLGTWLGRGQRCGWGDAGCGPALSSMRPKQLPEAQASTRTSVIFSAQLLGINHSSVWGAEASRTLEQDTWITK